jgi:hypothetical protein
MGGACGTFGETVNFNVDWVRKPKKRDHLRDIDVDGRIILKWILK